MQVVLTLPRNCFSSKNVNSDDTRSCFWHKIVNICHVLHGLRPYWRVSHIRPMHCSIQHYCPWYIGDSQSWSLGNSVVMLCSNCTVTTVLPRIYDFAYKLLEAKGSTIVRHIRNNTFAISETHSFKRQLSLKCFYQRESSLWLDIDKSWCLIPKGCPTTVYDFQEYFAFRGDWATLAEHTEISCETCCPRNTIIPFRAFSLRYRC